MGKPSAASEDIVRRKLEGALRAISVSAHDTFDGKFNVTISGTFSGTVKVERSFDAGANWHVCSRDSAGTEAAFTAPASIVLEEPEAGVLYRLNCTAYTSGTINYRISQ